VTLPAEIKESKKYQFHPALLDSCLQCISTAFPSTLPGKLFLPVATEQIRYYRRMETQVQVYCRLNQINHKALSSDLKIFSNEGELLLEISGFQCRAIDAANSTCSEYRYFWPTQALSEPLSHSETNHLPAIEQLYHTMREETNSLATIHGDQEATDTDFQFLDDLAQLNQLTRDEFGDPETSTRTTQYEMAYRMQTSVPELNDLSDESESTFERYGPDARKPGSFARNCLLARRLAERDVRFIQLFHRGWDQHTRLPGGIRNQARDVDQAQAALIKDLKERGLLDDTLVVWGGEFGRSAYCQGKFTEEVYGRDHHPRCFTMWMAGGGVKPGITHGETDEFSYNIVKDPVHVYDLHATILHLLGIDHTKLTYHYQGRDFRLTDVHGEVVNNILA
jgi:hypothetical protein